MKKIVFLFFSSVVFLNLNAQVALKEIRIKDKEMETEEHFFVQKKNKQVRHGEYTKTFKGKIAEKGIYSEGKKLKWEFYNYDGDVCLTYDFEKDTITYIDTEAYRDFFVNDSSQLDRPAIPLTSMLEFRWTIAMNLSYPMWARENDVQGTVEISIEMDDDGNIIRYNFLKPVHESLDNEAMETVKKVSGQYKWLPAIKNNKQTESTVRIPIVFRLN